MYLASKSARRGGSYIFELCFWVSHCKVVRGSVEGFNFMTMGLGSMDWPVGVGGLRCFVCSLIPSFACLQSLFSVYEAQAIC